MIDMWEAMSCYLTLLEQHHALQQNSHGQPEKTKDPILTRIKYGGVLLIAWDGSHGFSFRTRYITNICRLVGQLLYLVVKGSDENALVMTTYFRRLLKVLDDLILET